jgi:endoglucanase
MGLRCREVSIIETTNMGTENLQPESQQVLAAQQGEPGAIDILLTQNWAWLKALVAGKTDTLVPDAWGGYQDAGDWDRRIQHLLASRLMIELADLHPDYFARLSLNIPESNDGLADVVSEALFNLDCYRRMQTADGGIRGGIESEEHPRNGETSWQESLTVMAYAPGVWSSYIYAGVAAQAAHWLESRDAKRAALYRDSALRAMNWADARVDRLDKNKYGHEVRDQRNLAAAELYRLTGDAKWHKLFRATTAFTKDGVPLFVWKSHEQRHAAWVYARTKREVDAKVQARCRAGILADANERVQFQKLAGFRWAKYQWLPAVAGAFTAPDATCALVRAHALTGDVAYLRSLVLAAQHGAGANPLNICYTTGVGDRHPRNAMHIDSRISGQFPPPGLTVYGPVDTQRHGQPWANQIVNRFCHPRLKDWPVMESYFDIFWYPVLCEFTIHQSIAPNAYAWGHLAAREPLKEKGEK